ncbi:MAG: hypothetical protein RMK20_11665, partial [Verrucomicrobiales bacterium]|nr:hypothetical protein [Verrucomicrobiales bacterium]
KERHARPQRGAPNAPELTPVFWQQSTATRQAPAPPALNLQVLLETLIATGGQTHQAQATDCDIALLARRRASGHFAF